MNAREQRERITPDAHWIVYAFYPWDEYTQAEVRLESRVGGVRGGMVVWTGHLGLGRRDLTGKTPRDCAVMLGDELWRHLHGDAPIATTLAAVGIGVPLGTTGGIVGEDPLPGL